MSSEDGGHQKQRLHGKTVQFEKRPEIYPARITGPEKIKLAQKIRAIMGVLYDVISKAANQSTSL